MKTIKSIDDILKLVEELFIENQIVFITLSGHKKGVSSDIKSVRITPVSISGKIFLQFEKKMRDGKSLHSNLTVCDALSEIKLYMESVFFQMILNFSGYEYQIFTSKKNDADFSARCIKKTSEKIVSTPLSHDRKKNHILDEDVSYNFLTKLGIADGDGKIIPSKRSTFRRLNRYLEFIRDILPHLIKFHRPQNSPLKIIDFGCGKAYLTFALYHYLVEIEKLNVEIIGLDLKKDVIFDLNKINDEIKFKNLHFKSGDIKNYENLSNNPPDMVVSLHACDVATDAAIIKAVDWGCSVILSVPCCQHEINNIIGKTNYERLPDDEHDFEKNKIASSLQPVIPDILKHKLFKERFSTLLTDSLRGLALESKGYRVQMVEFIDMEHTPKNVLIKALKKNSNVASDSKDRYFHMKRQFGIGKIYLDKIF